MNRAQVVLWGFNVLFRANVVILTAVMLMTQQWWLVVPLIFCEALFTLSGWMREDLRYQQRVEVLREVFDREFTEQHQRYVEALRRQSEDYEYLLRVARAGVHLPFYSMN